MADDDWLAARFESSRPRLRAMAYRMLGSLSDAEDALQEGWIHAAGADARAVGNLEGWFTTIVTRVCLDMLRSRKSRREEPLARDGPEAAAASDPAAGPEQEVMLADSVGLALLVVLDRLAPAERVAFVLHDMFGVAFGEIAAITGRSPAAARQLASRARRRVQRTPTVPGALAARRRELVGAFFAATREGDLEALLAVLDPDVELHADAAASPRRIPTTLRGAADVAAGARAASQRARYSGLALVDGNPGIVTAQSGRLMVVLTFAVSDRKITRIDVTADPARLRELDIAVLS